MNKISGSGFTFMAGLLGLVAFLSCTSEEPPQSPAIVIIGNESFRIEDLQESIPKELYGSVSRVDLEDYVNRWIDSHILYQKGLEMGLANHPDIRKRVREFEIRLIGSAFLDSTLETRVTVTQQEIEKFYDENKDIFVRDKQEIHLKHVLLPDKQTADDVYRTLRRKRAKFDSLMLKYNAGRPDNEKDLGYVSKDDVVEVIWSKVKNYRIGAVVPAIKTDFGYHIFKIVDKKAEGSTKMLAEVEREIEARLRQEKLEEKYNSLLTQLKSTVKIETYFDLLNRIPIDSIFAKPNPGIARRSSF